MDFLIAVSTLTQTFSKDKEDNQRLKNLTLLSNRNTSVRYSRSSVLRVYVADLPEEVIFNNNNKTLNLNNA